MHSVNEQMNCRHGHLRGFNTLHTPTCCGWCCVRSCMAGMCIRARFNPIWEFGYTIQGTPCDMVFTSVAGHLMELDFTQQHKRWHSCNPVDLYNAPVVKSVPDVSNSWGHGDTSRASGLRQGGSWVLQARQQAGWMHLCTCASSFSREPQPQQLLLPCMFINVVAPPTSVPPAHSFLNCAGQGRPQGAAAAAGSAVPVAHTVAGL